MGTTRESLLSEGDPLLHVYIRVTDNHGRLRKSLELGCGVARYSLAMATQGRVQEIVGVDICETAIRKAAKFLESSGISADFVTADVCNLPFRRGSFDFVHSQGLYEHFDGCSRQRVIQESVAVLDHGGLLLFFVPNKLSVSYNLKRFIAELRGRWVFWDERPYTIKEALCRLQNLPVVIEEVGGLRLVTGYATLLTRLYRMLGKVLNLSIDDLLHSLRQRDCGLGLTYAVLAEALFVLGRRA